MERSTAQHYYERFRQEYSRLLALIDGLPNLELQQCYALVILNRLMFLYFLQHRGWLAGDRTYLHTKLTQLQSQGHDHFYHDLLCPLFFDGLTCPPTECSLPIQDQPGTLPYLNKGLFQRHPIEECYGPQITIPDHAFVGLFTAWDTYHWSLDERSAPANHTITAEMLDYIFAQHINQKQMGTYYTQEDVTGYISQNTIIPFVLDTVQQQCPAAFAGEQSLWHLLRTNPDRYIYPDVRHGTTFDLPPMISAGRDDVNRRMHWNTPAPPTYGLPTEIWREVVARRQHYHDLRAKLVRGDIGDCNDLVTYNLDIRQFAQDAIQQCPADVLQVFYQAMTRVTVLDPTCGTGAFLFAALHILEPLYAASLERMQAMVRTDVDSAALPDFHETLNQMARHPNRHYFIRQSILVNNLFGVDIMAEAVEFCKLRLYLKLLATIAPTEQIPPLPNLDNHIQRGNTLVGFVRHDEIPQAQRSTTVGRNHCGLDTLNDKLHRFLATEYGVTPPPVVSTVVSNDEKGNSSPYIPQPSAISVAENHPTLTASDRGHKTQCEQTTAETVYNQWLATHQPFHWCVAFYDIMQRGGFDVIIGNPPYVEYRKLRPGYTLQEYQTMACGNLYALVCERALDVLSPKGRQGMIVPLSLVSTARMKPLQELLVNRTYWLWLSHYDVYPAQLFTGAKQRLTIYLTSGPTSALQILSTSYQRWRPAARAALFSCLVYTPTSYDDKLGRIPKVGMALQQQILHKLSARQPAAFYLNGERASFFVHRIAYNYVKAFDFVPYFWNEVDGHKKSEDYKSYYLQDPTQTSVCVATFNSNLFFWWWYTWFEGYHCGQHQIFHFPIGIDAMTRATRSALSHLAQHLMTDVRRYAQRKSARYQTTGRVEYDEFYPRRSRPIIDAIDRVLAQHYGFTAEELDFIINYDIKYRALF